MEKRHAKFFAIRAILIARHFQRRYFQRLSLKIVAKPAPHGGHIQAAHLCFYTVHFACLSPRFHMHIRFDILSKLSKDGRCAAAAHTEPIFSPHRVGYRFKIQFKRISIFHKCYLRQTLSLYFRLFYATILGRTYDPFIQSYPYTYRSGEYSYGRY